MALRNRRSVLSNSPTEIFDEVLSYLTPRDIRKLRAVSKTIYEKLSSIYYCENEIFVWRNLCDTDKIIEALSNSKRSIWHLQLLDLDFVDDYVLTFFEKQGPYVASLSVKNCHLPRGLLEAILLECDSLREFCYVVTEDFTPREAFDDFSIVASHKIVYPEVTRFKLVVKRRNWLPDSTFRTFFAAFPNVKQLHLEVSIAPANRQSIPTNCVAETPVTYTSVFLCLLKWASNLESLTLCVPVEALHIKGEFIISAMPNLNHLALGCENGSPTQFDELSQWSEHLRRIPSLEILKFNSSSCRIATLLAQFEPVKLTTRADNTDPFKITFVEFIALVKSKLKALELRHKPRISVDSMRRRNLVANETVRDLNYLNDFPTRPAATLLFPEYFRGLVHLRLEVVWNALLQSIIKYQVNLRSLYLGNCNACNVEGFVGSKPSGDIQLSIDNLKNLEHLTLLNLRTSVVNSRHFKAKFHFPRLKYLHIKCYHKNGPHKVKVPVKLFESFIGLEALRLTNFANPSFSALLPLCRKLFRLRYLRCEGIDNLNESVSFIDLSEFVFHEMGFDTGEDFYHKKLNKIVLINRCLGFRFFSPKISSFEINWIEF